VTLGTKFFSPLPTAPFITCDESLAASALGAMVESFNSKLLTGSAPVNSFSDADALERSSGGEFDLKGLNDIIKSISCEAH
jgi:hypothetical protein